MPRRIRVPELVPGDNPLPPDQARHVRDALRLRIGDRVELFTDDGLLAIATLSDVGASRVIAQVGQIVAGPRAGTPPLVVAAAVPKAARADWMIEKLSELGVSRFVPLVTQRGVVLPEGRNKILRWQRLAIESAKQSRRPDTMRIDPLTPLDDALAGAQGAAATYLSTAPDARPIAAALDDIPGDAALTLFIGPEGGWTDAEIQRFADAGLTPLALTTTILRIETAAIAAAAIACCCRRRDDRSEPST